MDLLIRKDNYYTPERLSVFYKRDTVQSYSSEIIGDTQKEIFYDIHEILLKHHTNFEIIINPLYDQLKINQKDFIYLVSLYGEKNVHDFSGINAITIDYKNYYENAHYRPHVAREIMNLIYNHN